MLSFANAKINIGLQITEKRLDGFHNIASCFYPVGWSDVVEIVPSDVFQFSSSGINIPGDAATNLCVKAYNALKSDFALPPVHIHLLKIVPIGAGMGGGSSDAAFVLKMLNEYFQLNLTTSKLEFYARTLGSDCAFFIENQPRFCFGKGDEFEGISLNLSNKKIVLVYPNLHISTAEAYAGVKPEKPAEDLRTLLQKSITDWRHLVKNDFEDGLFEKYPILPKIKQKLYDLGADYASMTGSGSTIYGIFDDKNPVIKNHFEEYQIWEGILL